MKYYQNKNDYRFKDSVFFITFIKTKFNFSKIIIFIIKFILMSYF